jgi:hypothetical protein
LPDSGKAFVWAGMISLHEGRGSGRKKPAERVFQLQLKVAECRPPVWRRLLVRESMWLSRLHDSIQLAFDWYDYQTHVFAFGDLRFGNPVKRDDLVVEDDRDLTLLDLGWENHGHFTYAYQFETGWKLDVAIEAVTPLKKGLRYPRCVAGERAGPPEDCGGPEAYHDMLACIKEPDTELGREWLEWLGPGYDPAACDLEKINRALGKLARR